MKGPGKLFNDLPHAMACKSTNYWNLKQNTVCIKGTSKEYLREKGALESGVLDSLAETPSKRLSS